MNFQQFAQWAARFDLRARQCTMHHWQVWKDGAAVVVNYYPGRGTVNTQDRTVRFSKPESRKTVNPSDQLDHIDLEYIACLAIGN